MKLRLFILIAVLLFSFSALGEEKKEDVDYIALAAILIKDGHYERAEAALHTAELDDKSGKNPIEDKVRFFTLKGLVLLKKQDYSNAKTAFREAINHGQKEPVIFIYLAQAAYGDKDYQTTLSAIERAGEDAKIHKGLYTLKAQSHWKLEQPNQAWETLVAGLKVFPDEPVFLRQQIFFLLELKLYQDAVTIGEKYLARAEAVVDDYLAIGSSLRKSKQLDKAIKILEQAKLKFPNDTRVIIELAHAYIDSDKMLAAAELFQQVASIDSRHMSEAAELFRRVGKLDRALSLNAQVRDKMKKLKQRLALLLEYEDFELAAAMEKPLFRVGLLDDQDIRYATAYSLFKTGDFEKASEQLDYIQRPDLFRKSTELRKLMQECTSSQWSCL